MQRETYQQDLERLRESTRAVEKEKERLEHQKKIKRKTIEVGHPCWWPHALLLLLWCITGSHVLHAFDLKHLISLCSLLHDGSLVCPCALSLFITLKWKHEEAATGPFVKLLIGSPTSGRSISVIDGLMLHWRLKTHLCVLHLLTPQPLSSLLMLPLLTLQCVALWASWESSSETEPLTVISCPMLTNLSRSYLISAFSVFKGLQQPITA